MAERPWTDEDVAAEVAEQRAAQGLPPTVEDPATLARIATIVGTVDRLSTVADRGDHNGQVPDE